MELGQYIEELRHQLLVAADAGGDDARLLAERLIAPLEAATRLVLLDALSAAAGEITVELAPGSVDVRLRGREPEFVVTGAPTGGSAIEASTPRAIEVPAGGGGAPAGDNDDGGTARITLRLPESLKLRIEEVAGRTGVSVNSWLVRTVADSLDPGERDQPTTRADWTGGQHFTGWAR